MASKAAAPPISADPERQFFGRELVGILEAVAALLVLLALVSSSRNEPWIGSFGHWAAKILIFLVGGYIAYVVPVLMGISAWNSLRSDRSQEGRTRSWARGVGSIILIVAACGLLAAHVGLRERLIPVSREAVFASGGFLGNFLIDSAGINLPRLLGIPGTFVALYGLLIAGVVLFTETFLRDIGRLSARLALAILPRHWLPSLETLRRPFVRVAEALRLDKLRNATFRFLSGISFRRAAPPRVLAAGPIIDIYDLETPEVHRGARRTGGDADSSRAAGQGKKTRAKRKGRKAGAANSRDASRSRVFPSGAKDDLVLEEASADPANQPEFELFPTFYELPSLDLLAEPPANTYRMSKTEAEEFSHLIEDTLAQFRIEVRVTEVIQGPVVTRFALKIIGKGVRVNRIQTLENDLALALRAQHVRILTPIPGQAAVGIEVPNKRRNPVCLRELLESDDFQNHPSSLAFALGKNISGEPVIADLAQMPHILIAGATGSGKSVCLNSLIASLLFRNRPDEVKMIMIDPKRVELSIYQAIPHLLAPVVSEARKAAAALAWTVDQMEQRYKLLADLSIRNIEAYNERVANNPEDLARKHPGRKFERMPRIVVIIDELADLMMVAKNEVEEYVIRLAQMARAVGIHLVLATQRPSVNVITGIIKANFATRIAFRVSSKVDSRTILDMNGAEALLGRGDMLFSPGGVKPFRIQGAFVSDSEIESLADTIRSQEKAVYEKDDFDYLPTPAERAKAQLMARVTGNTESGSGGFGGSRYGTGANASVLANAGIDPDSGDLPPDTAAEIEFEEPTSEFPSDMAAASNRPPALAVRGRVTSVPLPPVDMSGISDEDLYDIALRLVLESRKASVSYIQRRLKIGYARAGRIMDMMEDRGIVGPYQGSKPRNLAVDAEQYLAALRDNSGE